MTYVRVLVADDLPSLPVSGCERARDKGQRSRATPDDSERTLPECIAQYCRTRCFSAYQPCFALLPIATCVALAVAKHPHGDAYQFN